MARECECGNKTKRSYKAVSGEICCSECFSPLKIEVEVKRRKYLFNFETKDSYDAVLVYIENEIEVKREVVKSFSKFAEDYAFTLCNNFVSCNKIDMERTTNTKFYEYIQTNSGGSYHSSEKEGIDEYVIIEALNAEHANEIAENIGLYFDGCDNGRDCECFGDRWRRTNEENGYDVPSLYGEPLSNNIDKYYHNCCFIHYLDGKVAKI